MPLVHTDKHVHVAGKHCPAPKPRPKKPKGKGIAKQNMKGTGPTYNWRHDGIVASRFCNAKHDSESFAKRLVFDYKVSLLRQERFMPMPGVESISLHDIVAGDLSQDDLNMHVGALSEFMKTLLLTAPSAAAMEQRLESTGIDPLGTLHASAHSARNMVYGRHAVLAPSRE